MSESMRYEIDASSVLVAVQALGEAAEKIAAIKDLDEAARDAALERLAIAGDAVIESHTFTCKPQ